jgi:hypothetical protein
MAGEDFYIGKLIKFFVDPSNRQVTDLIVWAGFLQQKGCVSRSERQ